MIFQQPPTNCFRWRLLPAMLFATIVCMACKPAWAQDSSGEEIAPLSDEQLDELVGPIALYPDKLIAVVLPASTYPLEIVQAYRLLEKNKNKMSEDAIKNLDFDPSVLALMHYPDALGKLNADLDWTTQLGDAVANQQEDVMVAIQRFRARALAAGNLVSNEQVIYQEQASTITIVSASPTVIYVPTYNPQVVVVKHSYPSTVVTFATGVAVGAWLSYGCNWHSSRIKVDVRVHGRYWGGHRRYGHIHGGVWGPRAGRRAAARVGARAGARAGYRTGRRHGARQGYRAGQYNSRPRTGTANRARNTGANRARTTAATRPRSTGANRARTTGANRTRNRSATPARNPSRARGSQGRAYGGYKSGGAARSHSSRGARSRGTAHRGGGGRSRGGGRRR